MTTQTVSIPDLRCPRDGSELTPSGDDALTCAEGHSWPVVRGIPRLFAKAELSGEQQRTAAAFGYSWTNYPRENPYTEEQWADWVVPLGPEDFEGKRVLDAGCGLAGFAEYASRWGAEQVVGADLSEAVDAARERVGENVSLVQADLHNLPFAPESFDIVYSIGVLHHLPEPERGFAAIAPLAKPGGLVLAWVYGRENNGWIVHVVDRLRINVIAKLPKAVNKWVVSLAAAIVLWPFVKLSGHVERMPYRDYLRWLAATDFKYLHGVVFDHLVAPTAHYIRREEFEQWFERAGLEDVRITWRNRNSWRGVGRVPVR
jgi:SAM-dependent methyltransferase